MTDARPKIRITYRAKPSQLIARVERQKRVYRPAFWNYLKMKMLPHLVAARALGLKRLDDLLAFVGPAFLKDTGGRPLSRSSLRRAIIYLHSLGLDPGQ